MQFQAILVQTICCLSILQQGTAVPVIAEPSYAHIESNLGLGLVLTVHGGYGNPGTVIDIYEKSDDPWWFNNNQLWRKEVLSDGTFKLISKLGDHVQLTVLEDGRAVTSSEGTPLTQKLVDGSIKLIRADKVKVLAVPGGVVNNSPLASVALETEYDDYQKWSFENTTSRFGVIESGLGSNLVLTIQGGYGNPGTAVNVYEKQDGSRNQLWRKEELIDGTFKLISKLGNHVQLTVQEDGSIVTSLHGTHLVETAPTGDCMVKLVAEEALTVPGGAVNNRPVVTGRLQDASNDDNQKWTFDKQ